MKYHYIAIQTKNDAGKTCASVLKVGECYNLIASLDLKGLISANIASTKKQAIEWADFWNECALKKGNYELSDTRIFPAYVWAR